MLAHPGRPFAHPGRPFALTLVTTNSALDFAVPAKPPESALALAGAMTHAPADARLPPAFEGALVLDASSGGVAQAVVDTAARDSASRGRARVITWYGTSPRQVAGKVVGWAGGGGVGQRAVKQRGGGWYAACLGEGVPSRRSYTCIVMYLVVLYNIYLFMF